MRWWLWMKDWLIEWRIWWLEEDFIINNYGFCGGSEAVKGTEQGHRLNACGSDLGSFDWLNCDRRGGEKGLR
jgi:hypothetical protein